MPRRYPDTNICRAVSTFKRVSRRVTRISERKRSDLAERQLQMIDTLIDRLSVNPHRNCFFSIRRYAGLPQFITIQMNLDVLLPDSLSIQADDTPRCSFLHHQPVKSKPDLDQNYPQTPIRHSLRGRRRLPTPKNRSPDS